MCTKMKLALQNVKLMNIGQLTNALGTIDAAVVTLKHAMQTMGTRYKLRVAIPTLRDYATLRKRLADELALRQRK